ncbi:MAG: hypothetical protein WA231_13205 [Methylocella sp.]
MTHSARATLSASAVFGLGGASHATDLPFYMGVMVGASRSSAGEIATKKILALNTGMFEPYSDAAPVIFALFSGAGGRFILSRPSMAPLEAPPFPVVYQLLKSVDHSAMAMAAVVGPHLNNLDDPSWRGLMLADRSKLQSAQDGLDATDTQKDWRGNNRGILQNNIALMDEGLAKGAISFTALQDFSQKQAPYLKMNIAWPAQIQVARWMGVVADRKTLLGGTWDKTGAAGNGSYLTCQNYILFGLAQFFGPDAVTSRLILIETISFARRYGELNG